MAPRHHVAPAGSVPAIVPAGYECRCTGFGRAALVDGAEGSVHTGFGVCELAAGGHVDEHVHSYEESFFVTEGAAHVTVDGRTVEVRPGDCGLVPVGVPHSWRSDGGCRWLDMAAPQPRVEPRDTFWTGGGGGGAPADLDVRDPRTRAFFRLDPGQMDVDNLKIGAPVDAPTVSASMATALLAYSGIAVKMLVDQRLGAQLSNMFMVEYQPGGVAQPHDHPLEETYFVLEGEVEFVADGQTHTLRPGDCAWAGVGSVHAFYNRTDGRVRWLETQAPLPPAAHSYRFNRDWDYLADRLGEGEEGS